MADIGGELKKIILQYNIDDIALQSIVESCLETEEISYKKAQTAYLFSEGNSYTEKISNVKFTFNLDYAIQILSASNKLAKKDKFVLLIGILEVIKVLKNASKIMLTEMEAKVLSVITHNLGKTEQEIVKQVKLMDENDDEKNENKVEEALKNLEKLGIITFTDGVYRNLEKVVIES